MTIIQKIQLLQHLSGLTQEKLAYTLGVSFVSLNAWVRGRSIPRQISVARIDELLREYTGEKTIAQSVLEVKKNFLVERRRLYPDILKFILERKDIRDDIILAQTYHSNSIEGSTLTEADTAAVLFDNVTLKDKSLVELLEAKNHQTAFEFLLFHISDQKKMLNEEFILRLHEILMNSILENAGTYRYHQVRIVGANIPTANYLKIPQLMKDLEVLIQKKENDMFAHVARVHSSFEKIHPFSDGNGRVGRLLLQAMLLQAGYCPALIRQQEKRLYYSYLNKTQRSEDQSLLENFLCDAVISGYEKML